MSIEAVGQNGAVLGSDIYWNQLNSSSILGGLMQWTSGTEYYRTLQEAAARASTAIEEIYDDLQQNIGQICLVPSSPRSTLAKQVESLYNVCEMVGILNRHSRECQRILELRDLSASIDPFMESALQTAHQKIRKCTDFLPRECIDLAKEAATWGISSAAGRDQKKLAFLTDISQGNDESFLKLAADTYETSGPIREVQGACGYAIGSNGYLDHIERIVFPQSLSRAYGVTFGAPDYAGALRAGVHSIADQLQADLEQNARDNNYITDSTEKRLAEAVIDLSRCGVSTFSFDAKIKELAWYVGGDTAKIQQLQSKLKQLGFGAHMTEDGVYGEKTEAARADFINELIHGTVPSLVWIDPLQSDLTGISTAIRTSRKTGEQFSRLVADGFGTPLFSADVHPYHGIDNYYHINVHALPDAPAWQVSLAEKLNHTEISKEAYDLLKNFENIGKVVEIGGRVLLAAGVVLDALELCSTIDDDLHDADRKIGKKTYSSIASIGGRWTGGMLGAKGGAMLGATIGTAILPGLGTAIGGAVGGVVLGVAGSFSGSALGRWVVDITAVE
jgi:hypothetical protein